MKHFFDLFRRDLWRKILALALACLLYYNLTDRKLVEKQIYVPVDVDAAAGLFVDDNFKPEVRITVRGTERALQNLKVRGNVRVTQPKSGNDKYFVPLDVRNFELRRDVEFVRVEPEKIEVPLSNYVRREIEVKGKLIGKVYDGFELKSVRFEPEKIGVSGPENNLNGLEVLTEDLDISSDRNFSKTLSLIPSKRKNVQYNASQVIAYVVIEKIAFKTMDYSNIPVNCFIQSLDNTPVPEIEIPPEQRYVRVKISVPQEYMNMIDRTKFTVYANIPAEENITAPVRKRVSLHYSLSSNLAGTKNISVEIKPAYIDVIIKPRMEKIPPAK